MYATRARCFRKRLHAEAFQRRSHDQGRFADSLEFRARHRIEIEVQIIGPINVIAARVPLIEIDASEIDDPQQRSASCTMGKSMTLPEACSIAQVSIQAGRGDGARFMKKHLPAAPFG